MKQTIRASALTVCCSLLGCCAIAAGADEDVDKTAGASATAPSLSSVERIWDKAPHNAFTDLVRFGGAWVCAFREAPAHKGGVRDSAMRILTSTDGRAWESAARLVDPRGDIRDAKMAAMPDGRLMLLTAIQLFDTRRQRHQSLAWFTADLKTWDGPHDVGDPDVWLWGIKWHKGAGYSIGYSTGKQRFIRLYRTRDGVTFQPIVDRLEVGAPYPNESAITFDDNDVAHILLRCDPDPGFVGAADPPYRDWTWKQANARIGGPALTQTPDGRLLGAGRLYDGTVRTSLFWVDPASATITECLTFSSAGDTSYPGLAWHDGVLHVSYYSTHEGKSNIYFARVHVPRATAAATPSGPSH